MDIDQKTYHDLGGTFRSSTTTETLARLEPLLPKLGITRVANVTGLDHCGIDVATCIRPNSKHLSVSQGKGLNLELAKISAIMESIEGYHAERPPETVLTDSYNNLKKDHNVIDPKSLSLTAFSNADIENMSLEWVSATNIINNETCYIPKILTCLDFVTPHPEYAFFNTSSNGLAAGNTLDEAICHSLYELIERDSLFKWQVISDEKREQTQVNIETITTGINKLVIDKFINSEHLIKIWEITSELGIPAFHCAIYDPNAIRRLGIFTGTGAHLSKYVALSRALTEAAQSKLTVISGNRDDIFPSYYERMETENASISTSDFEPGLKDYANCAHPDFNWSFKDNIAYLINILKQHGFKQVILVNLTKPEINIPVVQTLIPGLGFNNSRL